MSDVNRYRVKNGVFGADAYFDEKGELVRYSDYADLQREADELDDKAEKALAENQRLREALEKATLCIDTRYGESGSNHIDHDLLVELRRALQESGDE